MVKKISALELRHHLGDVLNRTSLRDDQFIIERKGKSLAVLVPVWQFEKIQGVRDEFFKEVRDVRKYTAKIPSEKLEKTILEAVHSVRKTRSRKSK